MQTSIEFYIFVHFKYFFENITFLFLFQVSLSGGDKVAAALGETAVDYCVGRPVDCGDQLEAEAAVWPVFVLWADGGVFCVQTGAVDGGRWTVQGPVDVFPEQETDYSQVMDI